jgi:hypothetical protein
MLQDYITPSRIANSILQKTSFKGSYIIVEGKIDHTLYKKFLDEEFCNVEIAFGNSNVIDIVQELNKQGFKSVFGIIDADFKVLDNEEIEGDNIFMTDDHDLELMIIRSEAFNTVVNHYALPDRIVSFLKEKNENDLKELLIKLISPLGYLKWANKKNGFGLKFKPDKPEGNPLPIIEFIPYKSLEFAGFEKMIEIVFNYSRQKSKINETEAQCLAKTKLLVDDSIDLFQLCNGHDVISITCIALRHKISNLNSAAIHPNQLQELLIFSYDSRYFENTKLYKLIKDWEKRNNRTILKF